MTLGTWTPGAPALPTLADFRDAAARWNREEASSIASLGGELRQRLQAAMQAPAGALDADLDALDAEELEALARLFTVIEQQPGFEAGAKSPVIALCRRLRKHLDADAFAELVRWIRAHSDNRFLPHGSLQDRLRV